MRISYDAAADAAYIQIVDVNAPGGVDRTYLCSPSEVGGMVNIDLDRQRWPDLGRGGSHRECPVGC